MEPTNEQLISQLKEKITDVTCKYGQLNVPQHYEKLFKLMIS